MPAEPHHPDDGRELDRGEGDGNGTSIFTRANYINNHSVGSYWDSGVYTHRDVDHDGLDPDTSGIFDSDGTHWLDDVAKFLYAEDMVKSSSFTDLAGEAFGDYTRDTSTTTPSEPTGFERQNVHTHTIGFATLSNVPFSSVQRMMITATALPEELQHRRDYAGLLPTSWVHYREEREPERAGRSC
jgi:hypothetical protein